MPNAGALQITTPTDREIVMTRVFDAPRRLVFDAMTKPELIKRWLFGPTGWTMTVCDVDLKVGGKYRYGWRDEKGTEMAMGGVYREIRKPELLVATELFDDAWYPGEAVDTTKLVEKGGTTTCTLTVLYESQEARDTAIKSGMDEGMAIGYDRLDEVLALLAAEGK